MTTLSSLTADDHDDWLSLWWGYLEFYEAELTTAQTELTFARLIDPADAVCGAIARDHAGRGVGLVHWLTHPSTWSVGPYCYLEDLFTDPGHRGGGVGRALIEATAAAARRAGSDKLYWQTHRSNTAGRALYDKLAEDLGFIVYERRP